MKPHSGRTIPLYFKVSPEEKELIEKKMAQLGIHNQRAYLRKMAVDGYAVRVDMSDFKALVSLLRICSNNLNQIAKRVNSTGNLYEEDVADLQERYGELWGAVSTCWGSWTIYKNCLYCIALMCYSVSVNKFAKEVARMRIIIKILLFPIVLALTLLVAFCRFFCLFSGDGARHCRVSVVPAGDRGIVRRTGGRIYRLPGSGVAGKPLRTAAGGLLADGTGGGL